MTVSMEPWSHNPNAPQIPYFLYVAEKQGFAGDILGSILYGWPIHSSAYAHSPICRPIVLGIIIILFFQSMAALLNPINRTNGGIKWGLAAYTSVVFSLVTANTAMSLYIESLGRIDNREFPGSSAKPPGPLGYESLIDPTPLGATPGALFSVTNALAVGFLVSHESRLTIRVSN